MHGKRQAIASTMHIEISMSSLRKRTLIDNTHCLDVEVLNIYKTYTSNK